MLARLGLGVLAPDSVVRFTGRNENWGGTTDQGIGVFVKYLGERTAESQARLRRIMTGPRGPRHLVATPRCLGWDERSRLVVFELLDSARNGAELAEVGRFGEDLARRAGRLVAALHGSPLAAEPLDPSLPPFPPVGALEPLPVREVIAATGAELELWRILQRDNELAAALRRLRDEQLSASPAPTHCDLRLDQFLFGGGRLYLTDWEELRLADPARDIGTFVGEWLFRSTMRMSGAGPSHEDIVEQAVRRFQRVRSQIIAFWQGYRSTRSTPDDRLALRAAAFAGWHQFDRLFAVAHKQSRLHPVERAVAGIGRGALLAPHAYLDALGLGTTP